MYICTCICIHLIILLITGATLLRALDFMLHLTLFPGFRKAFNNCPERMGGSASRVLNGMFMSLQSASPLS